MVRLQPTLSTSVSFLSPAQNRIRWPLHEKGGDFVAPSSWPEVRRPKSVPRGSEFLGPHSGNHRSISNKTGCWAAIPPNLAKLGALGPSEISRFGETHPPSLRSQMATGQIRYILFHACRIRKGGLGFRTYFFGRNVNSFLGARPFGRAHLRGRPPGPN